MALDKTDAVRVASFVKEPRVAGTDKGMVRPSHIIHLSGLIVTHSF